MYRMVILDRDGVINQDSPDYVLSLEQFIPIESSLQAIAKLKHAGCIVVVATNQSAVGRGLISEATLQAIHRDLQTQLSAYDHCTLDAIYYCPHTPDDDCDCRKPKPGLLQRALHDWQIKPEDTLMVGDSWRDLQPAIGMGCATALVKTGKGLTTLHNHADKLQMSYGAINLYDLVYNQLV